MQEFKGNDLDLIKTLQQVIIKNTADLDKKTRSKVYSKFQSVGYVYIDAEEAKKMGASIFSIAFYSSRANKIHIIKDKNQDLKPHVLLHEMIHSIADAHEWNKKGDAFNYRSGIMDYISALPKQEQQVCLINRLNIGINEGITDFFTSKFLDSTVHGYCFEVNIANLLANEIGYETLLNKYFSNDVDGLKKSIRNAFHLPNNYLIDKLFMQLDIFCNLSKTNHNKYNAIPIIKNCYETLVKMNLVKMQSVHKKDIKVPEDVFKYFNIKDYLTKCRINNLNMDFEYYVVNDIIINKERLLSELYDDMGYSDIIGFTTYLIEQIKNKNYKEITDMSKSGKSCLKTIEKLNSTCECALLVDNQLESIDKSKIIKTLLICLATDNKKIDFQYFTEAEKYEFITNCLFSPYDRTQENYKFFKKSDLIDYINNGSSEYKYFTNENQFDYIKNDILHLKSSIFFKPDFYAAFKKSKALSSSQEKTL